MKILQNLKNLTQKFRTKTFLVAAVVALGAGIGFEAVQAEFYPNRQPFDYNVPCNPDDDNIYDRCGSLTGPVFNSFINTPSYGDERAFADARRSDQTASGSYKNVLPDVNKGSKEVVIRTYVHNNANISTNASGLGVARGTKVRIDLPEATNNVLRARSYISANNAALVEDTVDFTGTQNFRVEYVPGSAKMFNNKAFTSGVQLSDSIITTGALIGDDALDGELPGCFEYEATVFITVKIIPEANPDVKFTKEVRKSGEKNWGEVASTKPGETVQWLLTTENTGPTQLDEIRIRDVLPPHVQLVPGTVKRIDASRNQVLEDGPLFDGGYIMGSYASGSGLYTMFDTRVLDNFEGCEIRVRNRGFMSSKQTAERSDTADLVIKKDDCKPIEPEKPVYACTNLVFASVKEYTYKFTASATAANGATVKHYIFNFGDGSDELVTDKNVVEHKYAKAGTYVVTVDVAFTVDGKTVIDKGNEKCVTKVSFDTKAEVTPPPTVVTTLPVTGAGGIAGILAAIGAIGAFAHRTLTLKRQ
jgi:uncharacterized repeat protein (TIGR01451 family)